jgi:hypothetical protein
MKRLVHPTWMACHYVYLDRYVKKTPFRSLEKVAYIPMRGSRYTCCWWVGRGRRKPLQKLSGRNRNQIVMGFAAGSAELSTE